MTGKDLLKAMNYLEDEMIEQVAQTTSNDQVTEITPVHNRKSKIAKTALKWAAAAAAAMLFFGGGVAYAAKYGIIRTNPGWESGYQVDITSRSKLANWKRITGGKSIKGTDCDLIHLVKEKADCEKKPRLYVSCGTADFLYGHHQKFVPLLKKHGWNVTHYEEPDATHAWSFWDQEIRKFITFCFEE